MRMHLVEEKPFDFEWENTYVHIASRVHQHKCNKFVDIKLLLHVDIGDKK